MKIVNTLPKNIIIVDEHNILRKEIHKSKKPLDIECIIIKETFINKIPISKLEYKYKLPKENSNVYYVVNNIIKLLNTNRQDFLTPTEVVMIDDDNIYCRSLS